MDASTIYDVPLLMQREKLDKTVLEKLELDTEGEPNLDQWKSFLGKLKNPIHDVKIGLVGKYNELPDAYKSIYESFIHAGAANETKVSVIPIHSERLEASDEEVENQLKELDGVLIAPGFGERGILGKLRAIKYIRENKIPFFGICLGLQCAVVEFSQNVAKLNDAWSAEYKQSAESKVIDLMEEQKSITEKGGTMRLGSYGCKLEKGSLAHKIYGTTEITERHRHRYEVNNLFLKELRKNGLVTSGINSKFDLVEIIELKDHPFFIGVQFHPELKSTVENPHPLFIHFIKAAITRKEIIKDLKMQLN
jgi:CTP synthase